MTVTPLFSNTDQNAFNSNSRAMTRMRNGASVFLEGTSLSLSKTLQKKHVPIIMIETSQKIPNQLLESNE